MDRDSGSLISSPLKSTSPSHLTGLATVTGRLSGTSVAKKYGFEYCTTDYHEILRDEKTDAVIISTRNDLPAQMSIEAMRAGKRVFVEKPLATTMEDLERVVSVWKECKRTAAGRVQPAALPAYQAADRVLQGSKFTYNYLSFTYLKDQSRHNDNG